MKIVTNIFSKLLYFVIIVVVIVITLNMFNKFKEGLTNNLYQCKVEFNSTGGTYIDTQTFKCGEKIENYSNPQKDGYVFEGWYLGEVQYNFDDIVVDDITLTAKWREKTINDNIISVDKVSFISSTYQMKKTDSLKLEIKIEPANATNKNVYYKSSNESIATINEYGIVTAKKSGSVEITVTTKDGGHKHTTKLTITSPVVGVKLNKEKIVLGLNDTYTLKATLTPTDPDNDKLTWSSSNPDVASVDKNGKVKAKAQGKAIITVTTVDGGYKAQAEVSVQKTVEKITLNKTSLSLEKTKTSNLTYKISPSNATDKTVSFTSSDKKVVIVDQNGKVTAIGGGEATITVKSNDGNAKATCKVTVVSKVNGVSLSEKNIIIGKGGSKKLSATITPLDATNKNLEWSSSNSKIVKVDSSGKITGVADGSATITVKTKDGSYTDKCTVTVKDLVLKIELDKTSATINKGATHTIKYTVTPSSATNKKVNFTSSDTKVATVDSTGKITGISAGKATITVKSNDGNASAKFTITVKVPLKGVSLNKTSLTLIKGESYSLIPAFNPTDAANKTVTWTSSDTKVATVNSSGKVTAVGTGTATITITTKEGSYKASTKVTVKKVANVLETYFLNTQNLVKDYGENESIILKSINGNIILIDTGNNDNDMYNKIVNTLIKVSGSSTPVIDYLIISHSHGDHGGNLDKILRNQNITIRNIIYKDEKWGSKYSSKSIGQLISTAKSQVAARKNMNVIDTTTLSGNNVTYNLTNENTVKIRLFNLADVFENSDCSNKDGLYIIKFRASTTNALKYNNKYIYLYSLEPGSSMLQFSSESIIEDNSKYPPKRFYAYADKRTSLCNGNANSIAVLVEAKTNSGSKYVYIPSDLENNGYSVFGNYSQSGLNQGFKYETIFGNGTTYYFENNYSKTNTLNNSWTIKNNGFTTGLNSIKMASETRVANVIRKTIGESNLNNIVIYQQSHHGYNNAKDAVDTLNLNRKEVYAIATNSHTGVSTNDALLARSYYYTLSNTKKFASGHYQKDGVYCYIKNDDSYSCNYVEKK